MNFSKIIQSTLCSFSILLILSGESQGRTEDPCQLKFDPASLALSAEVGKIDLQTSTVTNVSTNLIVIDDILTVKPFVAQSVLPTELNVSKKPVCKRGIVLASRASCILPISYKANEAKKIQSLARIIYRNKYKKLNYCSLPLSGSPLGVLDPSFSKGEVYSNINFAFISNKFSLDSQNRPIMTGWGYEVQDATWQTNPISLITRNSSNGKVDSTFDGDGVASAKNSGFSSYLDSAIIKDPRGDRILVAGVGNSGYYLKFARYLPNGKLDPEFGTDGSGVLQTNLFLSHGTTTTQLSPLSGGAFGFVTSAYPGEPFPSSSTVFGAIDKTGKFLAGFGEKGIIALPLPSNMYSAWFSKSVSIGDKLCADGVIYNYGDNSDIKYLISCVDTKSGKFDSNFGKEGIVNISDLGLQNGSVVKEMVKGLDNKLYVYISVPVDSTNPDSANSAILRLNADGSLDKTFANAGKALNKLDVPFWDPIIDVFHIDSSGRMYTIVSQYFSFKGAKIFRFNPNGLLDKTYGNNGSITVPEMSELSAYPGAYGPLSAEMTSDNKILIRAVISIYNYSSDHNIPTRSRAFFYKILN